MNAQSKVEPPNVYQRLNTARQRFHATKLTKTGRNTFAGYNYFELGDFLVPALGIFDETGLCALPISFGADEAVMTIVNVDDPDDRITFTSPMGSAALKGCHEVQNIGAVETYQRRYLWAAALEIVEHDALDATTGKGPVAAGRSGEGAARQQVVDDAQWATLVQLIEAAGVAAETVCTAANVASLKELPAAKYESVCRKLNATISAKKKEPA